MTRLAAILRETHKPKTKVFFCDLLLSCQERESQAISEIKGGKRYKEQPEIPSKKVILEPILGTRTQLEVFPSPASDQLAVPSCCWLETTPALSKITIHCLEMASLPGLAIGLVRRYFPGNVT